MLPHPAYPPCQPLVPHVVLSDVHTAGGGAGLLGQLPPDLGRVRREGQGAGGWCGQWWLYLL